ncbi:unnamed protein product [Peronospora farinosa]|uniref:Reverse transcriptase Ty1/copia-type domain-containing protein n=1 Tax=Peronospora farinosa TaxID=134698 RepID=A0ABN8C5E0_9STRA|nr:unnamed protein product [Peronospora farinosa]
MLEEIQALEDNDVWDVIKRPADASLLHIFGIDYALTFAAVMEMSTMKVILGLAATWGVPAKHGDVPNAYVKADKEEHLEILLRVPSGMQIKDERLNALGADSASDIALELKKSLYGLKQAGRLWSQLLQTRLIDAGFMQCIIVTCVCTTSETVAR